LKHHENEGRRGAPHAFLNERFLRSSNARELRILAEYLEPKSRFDHHRTDSVDDAFQFLVGSLTQYAIDERGAILY
jgi:hypothetical protein